MTSPATRLALAEKVEAARAADRELDFDILRATSPTFEDDWFGWEEYRRSPSWPKIRDANASMVPPYTASLDAAMTLIGNDCVWGVGNSDDPGPHVFRGTIMPPRGTFTAYAATPALALTAASLRALAQTGETGS
jgi:hypothetical protein